MAATMKRHGHQGEGGNAWAPCIVQGCGEILQHSNHEPPFEDELTDAQKDAFREYMIGLDNMAKEHFQNEGYIETEFTVTFKVMLKPDSDGQIQWTSEGTQAHIDRYLRYGGVSVITYVDSRMASPEHPFLDEDDEPELIKRAMDGDR